MKPILISFDGHNINDGTNYVGKIPFETPLQATQARTMFVSRAGATPVYAGKEMPDSILTITINCMGAVNSQLETLNNWFNVYDEIPKVLIIQDEDDSNKQYSIYATPKSISPLVGKSAVRITLSRKEPIWKSVTQKSSTWSITASGNTKSITNAGNIEAYPIFEFTPTSYPSGGWAFARKVKFYPTSSFAYVNRPVEILGGLDTAALVSGGKMLANGDDVRVLVDGAEVDRWFGDAGTSVINNTATKAWIVLDVPAKQETTLKTAIANTGTPANIEIAITKASAIALAAMPASGYVMIDDEEFAYSEKVVTKTSQTLTVSARNVRNTTIAAHSAAAVIRWIPFDIQVIYGNASATAPEIDNTKKPVINLATSTNTSFVYAAFYDTADPKGQRAGAWKPYLVSTTGKLLTESAVYYGENLAADTNPADVMGAKVETYQSAGVYKAETTTIEWICSFPDAVSSVDSNGSKYRADAKWFTVARLYSSILGGAAKAWVTEWAATEATPASTATWTAWSHAGEAVTNTSRFLKFATTGTTAAVAGSYMAFEVTAATITLVNYPSVALRAEESTFNIEAIITNSTTGEYILIKYPLQIGSTVIIDCDPNQPTAKRNGQIVNVVKPSTNRSNWLRLATGANTLTYTAAANSDVTCVVKWNDRKNFI